MHNATTQLSKAEVNGVRHPSHNLPEIPKLKPIKRKVRVFSAAFWEEMAEIEAMNKAEGRDDL